MQTDLITKVYFNEHLTHSCVGMPQGLQALLSSLYIYNVWWETSPRSWPMVYIHRPRSACPVYMKQATSERVISKMLEKFEIVWKYLNIPNLNCHMFANEYLKAYCTIISKKKHHRNISWSGKEISSTYNLTIMSRLRLGQEPRFDGLEPGYIDGS